MSGYLPDRDQKLSRSGVTASALSPDGTVAVTAHTNNTLRRWEGEHLAPLTLAAFAPNGITQLALSADASVVLVVAPDGVWRLEFPENQARKDPRQQPMVLMKALPKTFLSLAANEKRKVSDSGRKISRKVAPGDDISSVGEWIISGGGGPITKIRHSMTEDELRKWDRVWESSHFAVMPGTQACISGDGKRVATSAGSQPIKYGTLIPGNQSQR